MLKSLIKKIETKNISLSDRLILLELIQGKLSKLVKTKDEMVCINTYGDVNLLTLLKNKKRIGSSGKYGDVYQFTIPLDNLNFNLAIKLIPLSYQARVHMYNTKYPIWREVKALQLVSKLVKKRICPNLPLMYDFFVCNYCTYENPDIEGSKNKICVLIINELADTDLRRWLLVKSQQTIIVKELEHDWYNLFFQIFIGLATVYKYYQLVHNDLHWGNVLVNHLQPGGYWIYEINQIRFYLPNQGFLMKLWDFGKSMSPTYFKYRKADIPIEGSDEDIEYRYDWIDSDIDKITNIAQWIQNTYMIQNKEVIPTKIIQFISKIKKSETLDSFKLLLLFFRRYLNDQIGLGNSGKDIKDISEIRIGEIVSYQNTNSLIVGIDKFKVKLIVSLKDHEFVKVNYQNVKKLSKKVEPSNLKGKLLGFYRI